MSENFIRGVRAGASADAAEYPYGIAAVREIEQIVFDAPVTFLVGENGSGKSTIIEAIAVAAGFNAEGGTKNYHYETNNTTSPLADRLTLVRGARRERYGYFLRAESFYTTANYAEGGTHSGQGPMPILFDGKRIHEQSHGEAFLSIVDSFSPGLFIFDEPESALSPQRVLHLMVAMHQLVKAGSQCIIATHSPILLAYPDATIYQLSLSGVERIAYDDVDHVILTRDFMSSPSAFLGRLLEH